MYRSTNKVDENLLLKISFLKFSCESTSIGPIDESVIGHRVMGLGLGSHFNVWSKMSLFCHLNESRNVVRMLGNIQFSQLRLTYLLLKIRGKFFFFHFLFVYVSCNSLLLQWNQHTRLRDQYSFFSFSAVVFVYIRWQKKKKKADGKIRNKRVQESCELVLLFWQLLFSLSVRSFICLCVSICRVPPCACISVIKFVCWMTNKQMFGKILLENIMVFVSYWHCHCHHWHRHRYHYTHPIMYSSTQSL